MQPPPPLAVVLGDINLDLAMFVDGFPSPGSDAPAQRILWGGGGGGLNAAVALRTIGARVCLVARVGDDPAGELALQCAQQRGVDCSCVQRAAGGSTGLCTVVVTPDGQRTFLSHRGENVRLSPEVITSTPLRGCRLLFVSAYALLDAPQAEVTLRLVQHAFDAAVPVVVDACAPAVSRCRDMLFGLAPRLHALIANEAELEELVERRDVHDVAAALLAQGLGALVVKRGERGCSVMTAKGHVDAPAQQVRVVDTTACGDVFSAACAWALVHDATPLEGAQLANTFGALTATGAGAVLSIPAREALEARLPQALSRFLVPLQSEA